MAGPWKLSALGLLSLAATVSTSTLSTAYLMRPPLSLSAVSEPEAMALPEPPRPAIVRIAPVAPHRARAAAAGRDDCGIRHETAARPARPGSLAADPDLGQDAPGCGAARVESLTRAPGTR